MTTSISWKGSLFACDYQGLWIILDGGSQYNFLNMVNQILLGLNFSVLVVCLFLTALHISRLGIGNIAMISIFLLSVLVLTTLSTQKDRSEENK